MHEQDEQPHECILSCKGCQRHKGGQHRDVGYAMQALIKEGEVGLLPTVMEAYARPTRIVRGKDVGADWAVDEARFDMEEERALWAAYQSTRKAVHPAMGIREFLEVRTRSYGNSRFVIELLTLINASLFALLQHHSFLRAGLVAALS